MPITIPELVIEQKCFCCQDMLGSCREASLPDIMKWKGVNLPLLGVLSIIKVVHVGETLAGWWPPINGEHCIT
jgi:hypothetical protein